MMCRRFRPHVLRCHRHFNRWNLGTEQWDCLRRIFNMYPLARRSCHDAHQDHEQAPDTCCHHGMLTFALSVGMADWQLTLSSKNIALIVATIIALPVGRASQRNDGHFIFANVENLTTWPTGWSFMLAWLSRTSRPMLEMRLRLSV